MKVKVSVSQYNVPEKTKDSYRKALDICIEAKEKGSELIVLPETALGMLANVKNLSEFYEEDVRNLAKDSGIYVCTSFYKKDKSGKFYNEGVIVRSDGEILLNQNKIYLAPPERIVDGISAGNELRTTESPFGRLAMLICKDSFNRYSHFLYERFSELNTDIILIPTWSLGIFNINTEAYIRNLLSYGAMISRSFILVAGNTNPETKSFGQSMIIDPIDGVIKIGSRIKEEIISFEINLDKVFNVREFDKKWQPEKRLI